jgi:predicted ester cyclase
MGIASTGGEVTFEGLTIDRVVEGNIMGLWFGGEPEVVMEQIGTVLRSKPAE